VELAGFEPATFCLPDRRTTRLCYSPRVVRQSGPGSWRLLVSEVSRLSLQAWEMGTGVRNRTDNARKHGLMRPASLPRLVPEMVAQPGFEPGTTGYGPVEIPFLYRASMVVVLRVELRFSGYEPGALPLDDTTLRWGDRGESNPLTTVSQTASAPFGFGHHGTPTRCRAEPPSV
jgi:hypothetical protein